MGDAVQRKRSPDSAARSIGPPDAIATATRHYLEGRPIDMSALASELGVGRATLYRWVGNREELLALLLSEATERTFYKAASGAQGSGAQLVLNVMDRFMHAVLDAPPLKAFTQREPLLFIRLALMPGAIETSATSAIADLLEQESAADKLDLALPAPVLAEAIVRICDSHLYAQLLRNTEPEINTALQLTAMLLRTHYSTIP